VPRERDGPARIYDLVDHRCLLVIALLFLAERIGVRSRTRKQQSNGKEDN